MCGLPQGSCLGPVGWLLYASKLFDITKSHKPDVSAYTDDSKLALCFSSRSDLDQERADLGLWVDSNKCVNKCVTKAHKQLYWINQIRPCLNNDTANTIVHAFVTSSLGYCNAALYGISKGNMNKLQQVQNSAARVVSNTRKYDHITPELKELHWLKIEQRIIFKIALLVFKCLNNMSPPYFIELNPE